MKQTIAAVFLFFNLIAFSHAGETLKSLKNNPVTGYSESNNTDPKASLTFPVQPWIKENSGIKSMDDLNLIPENIQKEEPDQSRTRFRFGLSSGPGYLAGSVKDAKASFISKGLDEKQVNCFFRQLRVGFTGSVNLHYLITRNFGAGINALFFNTGADEWISYNPSGKASLLEGHWTKSTRVTYWGPSLLAEKPLSDRSKWKISLALSAGIARCRDDNSFMESIVDLSGKALAATGSLGLHYSLARNISFGINADLFATHLGKVTVRYDSYTTTIDLRKDKLAGISIKNLSVADISAGLKVYF